MNLEARGETHRKKKRRRFTPEFKAQIVLEILTGVQSPAEACRKHALSPNLLAAWKTAFLEKATPSSRATSSGMRTRPASPSWSNCSGGPPQQIEILKKQRPSTGLNSSQQSGKQSEFAYPAFPV